MGRVIQQDKTIGGANFSTASTFNLASKPLTQTLPNQTTISRHYNCVGQLESITSDWIDAQHPATLASNLTYAPSGALLSVEYGNGTTKSLSLDCVSLAPLFYLIPRVLGSGSWGLGSRV